MPDLYRDVSLSAAPAPSYEVRRSDTGIGVLTSRKFRLCSCRTENVVSFFLFSCLTLFTAHKWSLELASPETQPETPVLETQYFPTVFGSALQSSNIGIESEASPFLGMFICSVGGKYTVEDNEGVPWVCLSFQSLHSKNQSTAEMCSSRRSRLHDGICFTPIFLLLSTSIHKWDIPFLMHCWRIHSYSLQTKSQWALLRY